MLKLGLGAKLSNRLPSSPSTANWKTWTGSNDGPVTNIATGGGTGSQDIVMVSDTEAVLLYRASDESARAVVLDIDESGPNFEAIDTNSEITLTQGSPIGMNIVMLSETKFVCFYEDTSSGSVGVVVLLTKSGKTLTETDVETTIGLNTPNFRNSLTAINETQAVAIMRDDGDSNEAAIFVIDISGDNITIGAKLDTGLDVQDYPSVCKAKADGSAAFAAIPALSGQGGGSVVYVSVSGTTLTVEDTISISGTTSYDDMMIGYVADDVALCAYELRGSSTVNVNVFSYNGSTLSKGTEATGIFGSNDIFQGTGTVTELGSRSVMFSGRIDDSGSPRNGAQVVVSADESNAITVNDYYVRTADVEADHNVIDASPSKLYVALCYQDETTVPIQQIGTRILVADTA